LAAGSVYIGNQLNKTGPVCVVRSNGGVYIIADNNGCKVNVDYEPPEDGLVRAETYVGVKE
jgi:hypothetical protein